MEISQKKRLWTIGLSSWASLCNSSTIILEILTKQHFLFFSTFQLLESRFWQNSWLRTARGWTWFNRQGVLEKEGRKAKFVFAFWKKFKKKFDDKKNKTFDFLIKQVECPIGQPCWCACLLDSVNLKFKDFNYLIDWILFWLLKVFDYRKSLIIENLSGLRIFNQTSYHPRYSRTPFTLFWTFNYITEHANWLKIISEKMMIIVFVSSSTLDHRNSVVARVPSELVDIYLIPVAFS